MGRGGGGGGSSVPMSGHCTTQQSAEHSTEEQATSVQHDTDPPPPPPPLPPHPPLRPPVQFNVDQDRRELKRATQRRTARLLSFVGCLTSQQHASVSQGRICLTSQQHASVSQGRICLTSQQHASISQGRICLTSQQHASVSQGRISLTSQQHASVSQGRICLTSQQHASVSQGRISLTSQQHASGSQGRICSDKLTCSHTETEAAYQTFFLTRSRYTDTGPTSPSADLITPGSWQGSHWSAKVSVTGMTRPRRKLDSNAQRGTMQHRTMQCNAIQSNTWLFTYMELSGVQYSTAQYIQYNIV